MMTLSDLHTTARMAFFGTYHDQRRTAVHLLHQTHMVFVWSTNVGLKIYLHHGIRLGKDS